MAVPVDWRYEKAEHLECGRLQAVHGDNNCNVTEGLRLHKQILWVREGQIHAYVNIYTLNQWFLYSRHFLWLIRTQLVVIKQKFFRFYANSSIHAIYEGCP
jgi:hypothetical protein